MVRNAAGLAVVILALAACAAPPPEGDTEPTGGPGPDASVVRFVAFGDAGTGERDQYKVAAAMAQVCAARGCDFGVALGDNIYNAGASSPQDPQFESKFERPYANLTFPVYLVLGNHDNGDPGRTPASGLGPWYETGNNQVAYSQRTDRTSDRWNMPARHYNVTFDGLVDLLALDTNTLVYRDLPVPPDLEAKVQAQGDWVEAALASSKSPWRIAIGHHPYISNGPHGNAGAYDGRAGVPGLSGDYLKEFFEGHLCGKVDLYLAGHDHDLEWLEPVASCGATVFIVSGGGGAATYPLTGSNAARFEQQTHGFFWFEATDATLRVVAYDGNAAKLHEDTLLSLP